MFPPTRWTLVRRSLGADPSGRRALEELLQLYRSPVLQLYRARGLGPEDSEELAQELFAELVLGEQLGKVDPSFGRFRTWLRAVATHHHLRWLERARATKRGGGARRVDLDTRGLVEVEAATALPPEAEAAFDRARALAVMGRAMEVLRAEYVGGARGGDFSLVERAFSGQLPAYRELSIEAGMSVPALKSFLHRARSRFRALVTEEVRQGVADQDQLEAELAALFGALGPA